MTPDLLDAVVLLHDRPELGLAAGQIGTVVLSHAGEAFEIEFVDAEGRTAALATLDAEEVLKLVPNPKAAA